MSLSHDSGSAVKDDGKLNTALGVERRSGEERSDLKCIIVGR
jgi:hypothetical protein